jgi:Glu-tRNA(Gln) amidotransferase subunit E-like FAD-binding protein
MTIKNLFDWTNMKHGREEMRYRLETDREFFGDDLAENMETQGIIVVLEAPAYYLEEAEVLELAEAVKARMED